MVKARFLADQPDVRAGYAGRSVVTDVTDRTRFTLARAGRFN